MAIATGEQGLIAPGAQVVVAAQPLEAGDADGAGGDEPVRFAAVPGEFGDGDRQA